MLSILRKRVNRDSMVGKIMKLTILTFTETFQQKWGRKKFSKSGKQNHYSYRMDKESWKGTAAAKNLPSPQEKKGQWPYSVQM